MSSTQPHCSIDLAVERVLQLFVDRRRSATSAAANPALDTASRRFREPLLLPLERAGPEHVVEAAVAAPRSNTFANRGDSDAADSAPQSTGHRGSSCSS
jgi:hypothetical protein